jgi:hypothetical protein
MLMRIGNALLRPVAGRTWPLRPEAIIRDAGRRAGFHDFGDELPLDEPLTALCASVNDELRLHPGGRAGMTQLLTSGLVSRLRIEQLRRNQPEIFAQPVPAPIVITGLPRSGTTFLHRLLAQHPTLYSAPYWELLQPVGPGGEPHAGLERRAKAGRRAVAASAWIAPETIVIHELRYDEPDEEIILMAPSFSSIMYEWALGVPAFAAWYQAADHTSGYRYLRRALQAMQSRRPPGGRWVLKAPQHLEQLTPLLRVFPDATIVHTHRDPASAVVSLADYITYMARMFLYDPDPLATGHRSADLVHRLLRAAMRDRDPSDQRYLDVSFDRLRSNPLGVLEDICATADLPLDEAARRRVSAWLVHGQAAKHSVRTCSADDYGLDPDALAERFRFYRHSAT